MNLILLGIFLIICTGCGGSSNDRELLYMPQTTASTAWKALFVIAPQTDVVIDNKRYTASLTEVEINSGKDGFNEFIKISREFSDNNLNIEGNVLISNQIIKSLSVNTTYGNSYWVAPDNFPQVYEYINQYDAIFLHWKKPQELYSYGLGWGALRFNKGKSFIYCNVSGFHLSYTLQYRSFVLLHEMLHGLLFFYKDLIYNFQPLNIDKPESYGFNNFTDFNVQAAFYKAVLKGLINGSLGPNIFKYGTIKSNNRFIKEKKGGY